MDRAVCLSTNGTAESLGYGIPAGTDAAWFSKSKTNQSANESRLADWWPATYGQRYVP